MHDQKPIKSPEIPHIDCQYLPDSDGVEHAVEVEAGTLYEAVGLAIDRFRRCEHVPYEPKGMHEFIVESRERSSEHRLTRNTFDTWLRLARRVARQRGAKDETEEVVE
jgi:hypothetical protein